MQRGLDERGLARLWQKIKERVIPIEGGYWSKDFGRGAGELRRYAEVGFTLGECKPDECICSADHIAGFEWV